MARYTMNGHRHPGFIVRDRLRPLEREDAVVMLQTLEAETARHPERFDCLLSADPRVQLQDALRQIDLLLTRNAALVELVGVLVTALRKSQADTPWIQRRRLDMLHDVQDDRELRQRSVDPD